MSFLGRQEQKKNFFYITTQSEHDDDVIILKIKYTTNKIVRGVGFEPTNP
jgi:hypothetical protein